MGRPVKIQLDILKSRVKGFLVHECTILTLTTEAWLLRRAVWMTDPVSLVPGEIHTVFSEELTCVIFLTSGVLDQNNSSAAAPGQAYKPEMFHVPS